MISSGDGARLVALARSAIASAFSGSAVMSAQLKSSSCNEKRGVFVTLHKSGELRGCIGFIEPMQLNEAVVEAARAAAFHDPRFPKLEPHELDDLEIEVSVLSVPKPVRAGSPEEIPELIMIGRDGLILRSGHCSGLLLPQVAVEQGWDAVEFLEYAGIKAGLGKDAWKTSTILTFQAQVFR